MSTQQKKKLSTYAMTFGGTMAVLFVAMITANVLHSGMASAGDGQTGPGSPSLGGYCAENGSSWSDTCYGATWRYSGSTSNLPDLDERGYATVSGTSNQPGGTVGPCAETDEFGNVTKVWSGYYVLGLEKYSPNTYNDTGSPEAASLGENSGIHQNGKLCIVQGTTRPGCTSFQEVRGSTSFAEALQKYTLAAQYQETPPEPWDGELGWFCYDESWDGGGGGGGGGTVTPPSPPSEGGDGKGEFFSRSHAMTTPQSHDVVNHDEVSDWDGTVYLYVSTDNSSFYANFKHDMKYEHQAGGGTFENALTSWYVYETIDGVPSVNVDNNSFNNVYGGTDSSFPDLANTRSSVVTLEKGQTKTICHIIGYDQKYWNFHYSGGAQIQPPNGATGTGGSKACVVVTRPEDLTGYPTSTNTSPLKYDGEGHSEGTITYAGETAEISWHTSVKSILTRRIAEYKQIVYLISDEKSRQNGYYIGNYNNNFDASSGGSARNPNDPCAYYHSNGAWGGAVGSRCTTVLSKVSTKDLSGVISNDNGDLVLNHNSYNNNFSYQLATQETVIVPDYVGYKLCNSMGWRFLYYYGVSKSSDGGNITWRQDSQGNHDYWMTFDATCRTISKKPSMTAWNGSISTTGGVKTSTAPRNTAVNAFSDTNGILGKVTTSGNLLVTLYGSWSEYQLIANDSIVGGTSGAALARNQATGSTDTFVNYSQLSIANIHKNPDTKTAGYAGITQNSTLLRRLETYLRNSAGSVSQTDHTNVKTRNNDDTTKTFSWSYLASQSGIADSSKISGTRVYVVEKSDTGQGGNLLIDKDIKLSAEANSIYTLPRVVFFVDGDVTISGSVTQIDAWIIAKGNINTCGEFRTGGDYFGSNNYGTGTDTIHAANDTCSKQLSFNGPVISNSISLNRAYGADNLINRQNSYLMSNYTANYPGYTAEAVNNSTESTSWSYKFSPAEIFNYRADDYLWAYAQAGRYSSSYTESYSRELAPRY